MSRKMKWAAAFLTVSGVAFVVDPGIDDPDPLPARSSRATPPRRLAQVDGVQGENLVRPNSQASIQGSPKAASDDQSPRSRILRAKLRELEQLERDLATKKGSGAALATVAQHRARIQQQLREQIHRP